MTKETLTDAILVDNLLSLGLRSGDGHGAKQSKEYGRNFGGVCFFFPFCLVHSLEEGGIESQSLFDDGSKR